MSLDKREIEEKLELVCEGLLNLGGADYDKDKGASGEAAETGAIERDFGIEEWDWPQGVGLYGLYLIQEYYGDDRYMDFFKKWYDRNIEMGLPSKNINTTAPYLTLLQIYEKFDDSKKYEEMLKERAQWLIDELPKTKDGGFQHVTSAIGDRNGVCLNEGQLWVDTLFMAGLFLQQAGIKFGRKDWEDEALHQMLVHIKYLYCKTNGLFYHGFSFERNDNFGGIFWCRGNSWFTLGLTLFIEYGKNIDGGTKAFLLDTFRTHVDALCGYQQTDGLICTVINEFSSYTEVSGSAAMAAGVLRALRMGILPGDDKYFWFAERLIEGICSNIGEDGIVQKVSAGTGMGMDSAHYRNIITRPMAYGQALAIIALAEALRLN